MANSLKSCVGCCLATWLLLAGSALADGKAAAARRQRQKAIVDAHVAAVEQRRAAGRQLLEQHAAAQERRRERARQQLRDR